MLNSLSRYAARIETVLSYEERSVELARLLDGLDAGALHRRSWSRADAIHHLLVESIVRRKGDADFSDEVMDMLAATQAYEAARGDFLRSN